MTRIPTERIEEITRDMEWRETDLEGETATTHGRLYGLTYAETDGTYSVFVRKENRHGADIFLQEDVACLHQAEQLASWVILCKSAETERREREKEIERLEGKLKNEGYDAAECPCIPCQSAEKALEAVRELLGSEDTDHEPMPKTIAMIRVILDGKGEKCREN